MPDYNPSQKRDTNPEVEMIFYFHIVPFKLCQKYMTIASSDISESK